MPTRPKTLEGSTIKVMTGCGGLYVTINGNKAKEVFAHLGKAGGCSNCQLEALTRAITLGLKHGIPVGEFVKELRGLQCPQPQMYPEEERCLSCADGIARALSEYATT